MRCDYQHLFVSVGVSLLVGWTATSMASIREFLASSPTLGDQERGQSATLENGSIVYVWEDQLGENSRVLFGILDPAGPSFSAAQRVDSEHRGYQTTPSVAALSGGGFVIALAVRSEAPSEDYNVYYQMYSETGAPRFHAPLLVHTNTFRNQLQPVMASLAESGFVIAYISHEGQDQDIFHRRFNTRGDPLELEWSAHLSALNPINRGDQGHPDVAGFPDGGFILVFEDRRSEGVYGIRVPGNGRQILGLPTPGNSILYRLDLVTSSDPYVAWAPKISAFPNGQVVVAYNKEFHPPSSQHEILFRFWNVDDPSSGEEIMVGLREQHPRNPDVQVLTDETFALIWEADRTRSPFPLLPLDPTWQTWVRIFNRKGFPETPPFPAGLERGYDRRRGHLAVRGKGGWVMSWESHGQDGDRWGMYSRLVAPLLPNAGQLAVESLDGESSANLHVLFSGVPLECYELQSTTNFQMWTTLLQTNPVSGQFQYTQPVTALDPARFYRVERKLFP